ncbi:MAG: DUF4258 domain-containing protein [Rhizobiales bacterium]|nr:DUF4258 domain-containing protein [Hyphomicrobiales bacterium]MBI3674579.1 DUF4258 domain-containing protein [Hyphomicrobiales bacterium]
MDLLGPPGHRRLQADLGNLRLQLGGGAYGSGVSATLVRIQHLVAARAYRITDHAFLEMREDDILPLDVIHGLSKAEIVEDYPDAGRGPTVLVLCRDSAGGPLHAVWGMHKLQPDSAVLITVYRPKADRWTADFLSRRRS